MKDEEMEQKLDCGESYAQSPCSLNEGFERGNEEVQHGHIVNSA